MYSDRPKSLKDRSHPAWIGPRHIEHFETHGKLITSDEYGEVELLFARKFPENSDGLVEQMQRLIELKGSG